MPFFFNGGGGGGVFSNGGKPDLSFESEFLSAIKIITPSKIAALIVFIFLVLNVLELFFDLSY